MSKSPTFEESLAELDQIVSRLEAGKIPLQESIAQFERGIKLIDRCNEVLTKAEKRLAVLVKRQAGDASTSENESPKSSV